MSETGIAVQEGAALNALWQHPDLRQLDTELEQQYGPAFTDPDTTHTAPLLAELQSPSIEARSAYDNPELEAELRRQVVALSAAALALRQSAAHERDEQEEGPVTMFDLLKRSVEGDNEARKGALMNIATLVSEVTCKSGNVVKVEGFLGADGRLYQHGQDSEDILLNTFAHVGISSTTLNEAASLLRCEAKMRSGELGPDESYIEISLVPSGTHSELDDAGYFLETMSFVIRRISREATSGKVTLESAFVAGVDGERLLAEIGGEPTKEKMIARQKRALEIRHDHELISRLEGRLGVVLPDEDTVKACIIADAYLPHGVTDLVRLCDQEASRLLGKEIFFGLPQTPEDYTTYTQTCHERSRRFDDIVETVFRSAQAHVMRGEVAPGQVPQLLRKLLERQLVPRAIDRQDIDMRVFGPETYALMHQAIQAGVEGDEAKKQSLTEQAIKAAKAYDCPSAREKKADAKGRDDSAEGKSDADCEVTVTCPCCSHLNADGTPRPKQKVVAYIDKDKVIHCTRCGAKGGKNGIVPGRIKEKQSDTR